jgi:hypothetical protein
VAESIVNPAGNDGDTDQEITAPPPEVGEIGVIGSPLVRVSVLNVKAMLVGGISLTVISTVVVPVPPLFVALIV